MASIIYLTEHQETIQGVQAFLNDWNDDSDTIATKTSGSTGKPKTIFLKKKYMTASALASGRYFNFQPNQRLRLALSPTTIGGKMLLLRGLLHKMTIEVVQPSKNPLENLANEIDFISLVPYQFEYLLLHEPLQLAKVKKVLLGGAPVTPFILSRIQGLTTEVFVGFGMTETMSHVAVMNLKTEETFHALSGVEFSVNDNSQLIINAKELGISNLLTNDIVQLISSTNFKWKGRSDFVINSAGVKIHPEEVEKKLSKIITQRFFIIGENDEIFGSKVVLYIEGKAEKKLNFEGILTKYEIPKEIYYLDHFVETQSGKIDRLTTQKLNDATKIG